MVGPEPTGKRFKTCEMLVAGSSAKKEKSKGVRSHALVLQPALTDKQQEMTGANDTVNAGFKVACGLGNGGVKVHLRAHAQVIHHLPRQLGQLAGNLPCLLDSKRNTYPDKKK